MYHDDTIWSRRKHCLVKATWWRRLFYKLGDFWYIYYIPIIFGIFIAAAIIGMVVWYKAEENTAIERYNNGICRECGGEYEYDQAVGHYHSTTYMV